MVDEKSTLDELRGMKILKQLINFLNGDEKTGILDYAYWQGGLQ